MKRTLLLAARRRARCPRPPRWRRAPAGQARSREGAAIVNQVCAACHGADGNSASPANPSLAGHAGRVYHPATRALQGGNPRQSDHAGHGRDAVATTT